MGTYSKHFIFFMTHERAQYARVLHYSRLERLARDEHSSLLCSFTSYKENDCDCVNNSPFSL